MLFHIAVGCLLMVGTTVIHSGCTLATLWGYRHLQSYDLASLSRLIKVVSVGTLVLLLFIASLIEIGLWAMTYLTLDSISGIERALYFSAVTFTTLGYGDVVLESSSRLLASFQAVNGIIIFGWSTALLVAFVHRLLLPVEPVRQTREF